MKTRTQFRSVLRGSALAVLLAAAGLWLATGARVGWTQTSTVEIRTDEITGIAYPVRQPGFIAGIEIPVGGAAVAAVLSALSLVGRRPVPAGREPSSYARRL